MSIPDRRRGVTALERWLAPDSSLSIEYAASVVLEIGDYARDHWAASPGTDAADNCRYPRSISEKTSARSRRFRRRRAMP